MNRCRNHVLAIVLPFLGLLAAATAHAATATEVPRADWAGSVSLPSYVKMYIYVPANKAAKPPLMVSAHSCGSTASGQMGNIPKSIAAADKNGFIIILPDNPGQNCWDVGNPTSLKHDGGGDTQAVAQMVKYAISKYGADPSRVYIMGGSSGGMMTQAMLAVYPDVFRAGHARAGVPAGCWADSYDSGQQWSGTCAGGNVNKTAQQWGDLVRSYYPGYSGHRPRVQLVQGGSDTTISPKNMTESIEEWTNVLGLSATPTSKDTGYKGEASTYDRQFWSNACGYTVLESWVAPGQGHSMAYEETAMLKFFGLDVAGGADPEPDCNGDGGVPGTGGVTGSGGATAAGGAGGASDAGRDARDGGTGGGSGSGGAGSGGATGSGGSGGTGGSAGSGGGSGGAGGGGRSGSGGSTASGGNSGSGGTKATGGTTGSGGASASGGSVGSGGSSASGGGGSGSGAGGAQSSGGTTSQGGSSGSGGANSGGASGDGASSAGGCSCGIGSRDSAPAVTSLLLIALGLLRRRTRRAGR